MKKSFGAKTVIYPLPVLLIGTYDAEGKANIMTASWGGIINSVPPMLSVSVRKERHTFAALMENQEFSISIPQVAKVQEADYCGIYSNSNSDKIADLGLTAVKSELINAPIFEEFPVVLLCKVSQTMDLGSHILFASEILDFQVEESVLTEGKADIEKIDPLLYDTISKTYYSLGKKVKKAFSEKRIIS